eukprot:365389-Chlamydomonas_euryale.AAC.3
MSQQSRMNAVSHICFVGPAEYHRHVPAMGHMHAQGRSTVSWGPQTPTHTAHATGHGYSQGATSTTYFQRLHTGL